MSSLIVDNITNSSGTPLISNGTIAANARPGSVLEHITGLCDGSSQVGMSGTYTFQNVTTYINVTTSYQDLTGSVISYVPPGGTTRVIYRMTFHWRGTAYSGITHFKTFIDGTEIIPAYRDHAGSYESNAHNTSNITLETVINCAAASNDPAYGKLTSWTVPKQLKIQVRDYDDSTYQSYIHYNTWRDGAGASAPYDIAIPTLTIIAIA